MAVLQLHQAGDVPQAWVGGLDDDAVEGHAEPAVAGSALQYVPSLPLDLQYLCCCCCCCFFCCVRARAGACEACSCLAHVGTCAFNSVYLLRTVVGLVGFVPLAVNFDMFWVANRVLNPKYLAMDGSDGAAGADACLPVRVLLPGKTMVQRHFPIPKGQGTRHAYTTPRPLSLSHLSVSMSTSACPPLCGCGVVAVPCYSASYSSSTVCVAASACECVLSPPSCCCCCCRTRVDTHHQALCT